jgi:hypothetical protein
MTVPRRINLPLLAGLFLAAISLWFSATGLVHLFAGAGSAIVVMAIAFELAKVSVTIWLMNNLKLRPLPIVLLFSLFVLSGISSIGVYGYLSRAYDSGRVVAKTGEAGITGILNYRNSLVQDRERIYRMVDAIPAEHSSNRIRVTQEFSPRIARLSTQIDSLDALLAKQQEAQVAKTTDIGELRFAAKLFGTSQDGLASRVIILLAFLLDPLAVCLLLASGVKKKPKYEYVPETEMACDVAEERTNGRYYCTRNRGHTGPCAAVPIDDDNDPTGNPSVGVELLRKINEPKKKRSRALDRVVKTRNGASSKIDFEAMSAQHPRSG